VEQDLEPCGAEQLKPSQPPQLADGDGRGSPGGPITEYPNPARNKMRYRIADPYLVFWHRFVADIRARGLATIRAPEELWAAYIEPRLDQYMGGSSRRHAARLCCGPAIPAFPSDQSRWGDGGQRTGRRKWTSWLLVRGAKFSSGKRSGGL
jgi:hypothetical protein